MLQRTPEWMAARAGNFTSSRMKDLMAKTRSGPSASRTNLITLLAVERLTGQCVETYSNAAMERGIELEAEAREAYSFETGAAVEEIAFVLHPSIPHCSSSPDGLVGTDGLVELKVPASMAKHLEALEYGAHVQEYKYQLQHQLLVTDRAWVDAVSYDPRFPARLQLAIVRVKRDEALIGELVEEIAKAERELSAIVERLKARMA